MIFTLRHFSLSRPTFATFLLHVGSVPPPSASAERLPAGTLGKEEEKEGGGAFDGVSADERAQ